MTAPLGLIKLLQGTAAPKAAASPVTLRSGMGKRVEVEVEEGLVDVLALMVVAGLANARTLTTVVPERRVLTARNCVKWTLVRMRNGICLSVSACACACVDGDSNEHAPCVGGEDE